MCGIIACLINDNCINYIIPGIKLLLNRGFDSNGLAVIINNKLETIKFASTNTHNAIEKLEDEVIKRNINSHIGIGHGRWATHGGKTDINAHPHHDNENRIALVHNGIIENFQKLKKTLLEEGYFFKSQTDTEVIAVLIGKFLDQNLSVKESIENTLKLLQGTWALIIIHKDFPYKMWITRNGSPLLLGIEETYAIVASEQIGFCNFINKYIVLDNHDLIEVSKENNIISYSANVYRYPIKTKTEMNAELTPGKYDHWMIKEILEQPESILRALNNGGRIKNESSVKLGGLDNNKKSLLEIEHLILLGCGTSFNAGLWSLDMFKNLDIFITVTIYDGAEFNHKDIPKTGKTALLLLSQSGETKDLHRCLQISKDFDLLTIGVVNVVDSMIARETQCGVYLNCGREVAVASTKSYVNQVIVLSLIAIWFSQNRKTCIEKRKKIIADLRNLSFQMKQILEKTDIIENLVPQFKDAKSIFLMGKGSATESITKEGALKLKEISYIHAEGYSSSSLKHGTFALIEKNLPIIILDIDEDHRDKNRNAYQEIKARDAFIIRISDLNDSECELFIPRNKTYGGLLANTYLQLLSYYTALSKGINPDYPKNLAKVVTVE